MEATGGGTSKTEELDFVLETPLLLLFIPMNVALCFFILSPPQFSINLESNFY